MKKGVLRNFTKFTGKHLCQSLFFNKAAGPFLTEHLRWLLLDLLRHNHRGIVFVECWHVEVHQIQQSSPSGSLSDCNIALLLEIPISKSHPENENTSYTRCVLNM